MEAKFILKNKVTIIGAVTDFTYKWCINGGLLPKQATQMALAVTELITDVVLFAFETEEEFTIGFRRTSKQIEIIVEELGEPFVLEKHRYDAENALQNGNFEGAGFELIEYLTDDFVYIYKGKQGKEFRLVKYLETKYISDLLPENELLTPNESEENIEYTLHEVVPDDAEDIAKLIYRTYGYTYVKESLYYPQKIRLALERGEKFGVIIRTQNGEAAGYFAVLRKTDSNIGEVGEAVVSVKHRHKGLMNKMLSKLIQLAKEKGLKGVFGEAVTVHTFSQKANAKFDFKSTALLLGAIPAEKFVGMSGDEFSQPISIVIDFLLLADIKERHLYLPPAYETLLKAIYENMGISVINQKLPKIQLKEKSNLDLQIHYFFQHASIVVWQYGEDFFEVLEAMLDTLKKENLLSVLIHLPLHEPFTKVVASELRNRFQFIFSGLLPLFHKEKDYLCMQKPNSTFDFDKINVLSDMAKNLKNKLQKAYTR